MSVRRVVAGELGQQVSRGGKRKNFLTLSLNSFGLGVSSSPSIDEESCSNTMINISSIEFKSNVNVIGEKGKFGNVPIALHF